MAFSAFNAFYMHIMAYRSHREYKTGFPLHFEIEGTLALFPYFCTPNVWQHIEKSESLQFWGYMTDFEGKKTLCRG